MVIILLPNLPLKNYIILILERLSKYRVLSVQAINFFYRIYLGITQDYKYIHKIVDNLWVYMPTNT